MVLSSIFLCEYNFEKTPIALIRKIYEKKSDKNNKKNEEETNSV